MEMKCLSLKDLVSVRKIKTGPNETDNINDQKENICVDRRKMTPLKSDSVTTAINGHRRVSSPDITHITPIKHPERAHTDPWTPTANLKMLISAASPDIRDREMKKTLFRPIENEENVVENEEEEEELDDSCQFETLDDGGDDPERRPSRKQKSLGLLCQKFLALYPDYPKASKSIKISLDEVATCLGVERRRIYDIVNVLESLMLVSRMAKNLYLWHGRSLLPKTLQELQQKGREQGYHLQMDPRDETSLHATHHAQNTQASSRRKDKSLRIMSQKFVMLFLVSKTHTVTLDTAAKILIEEGQDESSHSKYKTKVRRLYDIANVLTSLNLIKKLHVREEKSRKPAFKWIGPTDFHSSSDSDSLRVSDFKKSSSVMGTGERREKMARHDSFQVLSSPSVNQRQINSAPSTPHRDPKNEPVDYSRKTVPFGDSVQSSGSPVPLQADVPYASLPMPAQFTQHPLAYLPGLPQAPLFMVYSGHVPEGITQGQRSPISDLKRETEEEEEDQPAKRHKRAASIESETGESMTSSAQRSPFGSQGGSPWDETSFGPLNEGDTGTHSPKDPILSSHYLYVPNTAGLNGLNFLMPAGHTQDGMPTVAVPYFLVPSPLIAGAVSTSNAEGGASSGLSFSLPTVLSPARFVMAGGAFGVTGSTDAMNSPEHHRAPVPTFSPQAPRTQESSKLTHTQTPSTPKQAALGSKSFFETPGAFGSLMTPPAARKRGSAQRRLDIGHPTAN
ncbi:transcription factor E2F7 isoform X2 [Myxocyprinus asiaticus]|uniref:transcription factor E2F7 isoform X2 n=1 Tax=Myxocyprinus asiaticus TaxID=70543 RepID=UPI0022220CAF|nr:transcription factor E2F7 isoform X2 [Myxocyprinus asiaticus]